MENEVFLGLRDVVKGTGGLGKHNKYHNAHCEEQKSDPGTNGRAVEGNCHLAEDRKNIFAVAFSRRRKQILIFSPLKSFMGIEVVANIEIFVMK